MAGASMRSLGGVAVLVLLILYGTGYFSKTPAPTLLYKEYEKSTDESLAVKSDLRSAAAELVALKARLKSQLDTIQVATGSHDARNGLPSFRGATSTNKASGVKESSFGLPLVPRIAVAAATTSSAGTKTKTKAEDKEIAQMQQNQPHIPAVPALKVAVTSQAGDPTAVGSGLWAQALQWKLQCLREARGGVLLYHVRKAAGTSMRDVLEQFAKKRHVSFFETEGLSLDKRFLSYVSRAGPLKQQQWSTLPRNAPAAAVPAGAAKGSLLSMITLRDPVERVMSLYWYEHVGWFDGVQHKTDKCATLSEWVSYWSDSAASKRKFMQMNPYSVYVEISNYYVKSLIGWKDHTMPLGAAQLEAAKAVLQAFDVVLLTEWMSDTSQIDALNAIFPGRNIIATKQLLQGDKKAKVRLKDRLAIDEASVRKELIAMNALDIELIEYARTLVAQRLSTMKRIATAAADAAPFGQQRADLECGPRISRLPRELDGQLGIHRPPGHKAPLK